MWWQVSSVPWTLAWLSRSETTLGPETDATDATCGLPDGGTSFDGPERSVQKRVAGLDGSVYSSLTRARWRALRLVALAGAGAAVSRRASAPQSSRSHEVHRPARLATLGGDTTSRYSCGHS
jgi:hypothetical protein